jgi:hypothetical protein
MDTIPVRNMSKTTVTASCSWSDSLHVGMEVGVEVSGSVKAKIFKLADAEVSAKLSTKLTMSATTARKVAGTFRLKPGKSVFCHRTFGYYSYSVKIKEWGSNGRIYTRKTTARVPYTLGALFSTH